MQQSPKYGWLKMPRRHRQSEKREKWFHHLNRSSHKRKIWTAFFFHSQIFCKLLRCRKSLKFGKIMVAQVCMALLDSKFPTLNNVIFIAPITCGGCCNALKFALSIRQGNGLSSSRQAWRHIASIDLLFYLRWLGFKVRRLRKYINNNDFRIARDVRGGGNWIVKSIWATK